MAVKPDVSGGLGASGLYTQSLWGWGSDTLVMPEGVEEVNARLRAEDNGATQGVLYRRGGEKTVVVFNHPRAPFTTHYLIPFILEAGYAVFAGRTRNANNDINCIHEYLIADLAAQVRYLRREGYEKVVLLGNSGGGSLSTFYQSQAVTPPPGRLTDTAAGDPYDLNTLDLSPADGLVLFAAHIGEGCFALDNLDPSVTDENDPLSCDPALDMYNPANGYRKPPEVSKYSAEFLERYREAQRARCERLDAMARQVIERRRRYRAKMSDPKFGELPLEEQVYITRMATTSRYLNIARVAANPAYTDLSIHPSTRIISTLMAPDPHIANYMIGGFSSIMTPEGWLSTWSGLSSRAAALENIKNITQPTLVVNFTGDAGILPHEAEGMFKNSAAQDKKLIHMDADHYGLARSEPRLAPITEGAGIVTEWLKERFPARG
jgi:pimeloyl-ACP methyl ester carboxylesterase